MTSDTLTSEATTPEPFDCEGNITGHTAAHTDEELQLNLQQQGRVSDSTSREEQPDEDGDAGNDGQMKKSTQEMEEDDRIWKMEIDLDEGRMEDEEEKEMDEEMKCRLHRLVAQSRLSYLSSSEDRLDGAGQSEGEWYREKGEDEDMEEEDKQTKGLTYKICQLEKEVRATQFSSTEDELDKIGIDEKEKGEEEEENEELVLKVCRLVNQVSASEFSSTEDELDRVGREGEETIDEESLWKLPLEEAAQLRDLVSLVRASQFSSTEDELDRIGENEGDMEEEVKEGESESSIEMEELWERAERERRESIGDLDVKMFELMADFDGSDENVIQEDASYSQIQVEAVQHEEHELEENKDCMVERVTGDETIATGHLGGEKVEVLKELDAEKEPEMEQDTELKTGVEAQGGDFSKPDVQQKNWLEAKCPDQEREDKFQTESKETERKSQTGVDSDEEFDRIISSMLLMTLDDMHEEAITDNTRGRTREPEDEETYESSNRGGEDGEKAGRSTGASEETGHFSKESQSQSNHQRLESEAKHQPEENVSEENEGDILAKRESADVAGRDINEQKESKTSLLEEKPADTIFTETFETNEAEEDKEAGRGTLAAEGQVFETRGDADLEREDPADCEKTDEEEIKESHPDITDQSSPSSLPERFLSAEEIQNVSIRAVRQLQRLVSATYFLLTVCWGKVSPCNLYTHTPILPSAHEKSFS